MIKALPVVTYANLQSPLRKNALLAGFSSPVRLMADVCHQIRKCALM